MTNILFIDEEYLRNYAPISAAVDTALIFPFVRSAQEENLLPIVGRALYERLKTSIDTDAVTEDEEKLLVLLRDALAWKTLEQYIVFSSMRLRNTGLVRQKGDTTEPATLEEITFFRNEARSHYDAFCKRVNEFLCENCDLFPEYGADDKPTARPSVPNMGIYVGRENENNISRDDVFRHWSMYKGLS